MARAIWIGVVCFWAYPLIGCAPNSLASASSQSTTHPNMTSVVTLLLIFLGISVGYALVLHQHNRQLHQEINHIRSLPSENELLLVEQAVQKMFENSAIGMGLLSLDRRIIQLNPAVAEISGYTQAELLGLNPLDLVHPDDRQLDAALFQELVAGQRDTYGIERRYVRKDGSCFWGKMNYTLIRTQTSLPLYIFGTLEDITAQKNAMLELSESEERFRSTFENTAIGMGLLSLEGRILRVNRAICATSGYTEAELKQRPDYENVYPADRNLDADLAQQLIHGKRDAYVTEKRYVRKNGEVFWARVNLSLVRGSTGEPQYLVGMLEDIDVQKRTDERLAAQDAEHRRLLEQRVAERTEELKQINQLLQQKATQEAVVNERTRLARDLHDAVTQTLFAATLIADVLPDIWKNNQTEGHRRLEELRQLTRGALAEMRTLLMELRPNALVETPLSTLLRQLTEAHAGRARVNIQLNIEGDCSLPPDIKIAFYRITQEALNNIVKHARASQAMVALRFGQPVRLTLTDNGLGFNQETIAGEHLGLKIMRERAEAIGAKLSLYSEPGEGTQLSVTWEKVA